MKNTLVPNIEPIRKVPYRGSTEHILPRKEISLQDKVDKILLLCGQRNMGLNSSMTKTIMIP